MSDALALTRCLIANVWNLLLGIQVPGIGISFAALFIALFLVSAAIFLFKSVLGGSNSGSGIFQSKDKDGD